eukprot:745300-Rhodomonas_salina.1
MGSFGLNVCHAFAERWPHGCTTGAQATKELLYTVTPVDMERRRGPDGAVGLCVPQVACAMDVDGDRVVVGGVD